MNREMIDLIREFFTTRGIGELQVSAAVSSVIMALWIAMRHGTGATAREATRRMGPAAVLSMIALGWFGLRTSLPQPRSSDLGRFDALTDLSLAAPAFGFALTVLVICVAVNILSHAHPRSETGGGWGNVAVYLLFMLLSYYVSFIIVLVTVLA